MDAYVLLILLSTLALFSQRASGVDEELRTCLQRNIYRGCRIFAKYKPTTENNCSSWMAQRADLSTASPPTSREGCFFSAGNEDLLNVHGRNGERDLKKICRRVSRFLGKFFRDLRLYCSEIAQCGNIQVLPHTGQRHLHKPTDLDKMRGEIDLRSMYQHVRCLEVRLGLHEGAQW